MTCLTVGSGVTGREWGHRQGMGSQAGNGVTGRVWGHRQGRGHRQGMGLTVFIVRVCVRYPRLLSPAALSATPVLVLLVPVLSLGGPPGVLLLSLLLLPAATATGTMAC